jgi:hypothetical protein
MNLVERWFGHLDNKAIRCGIFLSVADLQAPIEAFSRSVIRIRNPSCGPPPSNRSRRNSPVVVKIQERIKQGCYRPKVQKAGERTCLVIFEDITLAPYRSRKIFHKSRNICWESEIYCPKLEI